MEKRIDDRGEEMLHEGHSLNLHFRQKKLDFCSELWPVKIESERLS